MTLTDNFVQIASSSAIKAYAIDLSVNSIFCDTRFIAAKNTAVSSIAYGMRSGINTAINEYFELTPENFYAHQLRAIVSGSVGGFFKYSLTGQNPYVGMLNHMANELCNNFESCGNDPLNNAIFTMLLESGDAALQIYLNAATGNVPGAVLSAVVGGARVGAAISVFANIVYTPMSEDLKAIIMPGESTTLDGEF